MFVPLAGGHPHRSTGGQRVQRDPQEIQTLCQGCQGKQYQGSLPKTSSFN